VVRGVVFPPADVKAVRFWGGGELLYECYVGYDKRIKFRGRFVRELVRGVTIIPASLTREGDDDFLDAEVDRKIDLMELEEPHGYVDVEELV